MRRTASFGAMLVVVAWPASPAGRQLQHSPEQIQPRASPENGRSRVPNAPTSPRRRTTTTWWRCRFAEGARRDDLDRVVGKTAEGRELPYIIASAAGDNASGGAAARTSCGVHQANIHAGEVEGKARCSLLRDLLFDKHKNVLVSIVLIVKPIYNADGNEKWGPQARNRGAQNGPELVGTRQNASSWNLNRDYIGADAPETRGAFAMLNAWNPDLFMDLHTTDGSIHGYALTYAPPLRRPPSACSVFDADVSRHSKRVLDRDGFYVNDYGDFSRTDVPRGARGGSRGRGAPADSAGRAAGRGPGGGGGGAGLAVRGLASSRSSPTRFRRPAGHSPRTSHWRGTERTITVAQPSRFERSVLARQFARRVASTYDFVNGFCPTPRSMAARSSRSAATATPRSRRGPRIRALRQRCRSSHAWTRRAWKTCVSSRSFRSPIRRSARLGSAAGSGLGS